MDTLEITLPHATRLLWESYANDAGLSLSSLITEATTHSVRTDRLGVTQANLQRLLHETREAELLARKARATSPVSSLVLAKESKKSTSMSSAGTSTPPLKPIALTGVSFSNDANLDNAYIPDDFFENTGNQANLDTLIPRNI
jgi:hypothetical protein